MVICNTRILSSGTQGILSDLMYLCADCKIAGSSQIHSDTSLFQQWLQSVSGSIFSYLPKPAAFASQNEPTLLPTLFPSSIPLFLLSSPTGQIRWKKERRKLLLYWLLFPHLLIFIIRTGNINFILHILTPLRKLYIQVKDKTWSKLTDEF